MTSRIRPLTQAVSAILLLWPCAGIRAAEPTKNDLKLRLLDKQLQERPALLTAKPLQNRPDDDELQQLLNARYNERQLVTLAHYNNYVGANELHIDPLLESARCLVRAWMEVCDSPEQRTRFLKQTDEVRAKATQVIEYRQLLGSFEPDQLDLERHKLREFELELQIEMLRARKSASRNEK